MKKSPGVVHWVEKYPPSVAQRILELRSLIQKEQEAAADRCQPYVEELMKINELYPMDKIVTPGALIQ